MANKKKKTSTKGLAGIPVYGSSSKTGKDIRLNKKVKPKKVSGIINYLGDTETVTVPKQWLSSPDHVVAELAYITPAEQKILLEANLYGSLEGQPNRGPGGLMSLQGGGEQEAKDAGASNTSQASSSGSSGGGSSSSSSSSSSSDSGSDDGGAYDDDDVAAELAEMFGQSVAAKGRSVDTGRPSRARFGGYDPSSQDEEQTSAITIRDYNSETGRGGDFLSKQGREDLNVLAEKASEYFKSPITKAVTKIENLSPLANLVRGITGAPSITRTKAGLAAGRIGEMQTGVQAGGTVKYDSAGNVAYVEMPDGTRVGERKTFSSDDGSDSRDNKSGGGPTPVSVTPALTPNAYYQKGVGTQTVDLSDPVQRRLYLQNLIGATSSPIGGFYNPFDATYTMPDGGQKKVSGLDIFKRK